MADALFKDADPAVVILHYGDPAVTARLHRQLTGPADPTGRWRDRILVLDNASPQPWPEAGSLWTRLPENRYWAGALAWTLDALAAQGRSHVWFLNNDLWFAPEAGVLDKAWQRLLALERRSGKPVGAYSPAVVRHPYHQQMVQKPGGQFRRVLFLDGVAPLLRLEAVAALAPPTGMATAPAGTAGTVGIAAPAGTVGTAAPAGAVGTAAPAGAVGDRLDWEDNPRGYGVDLWLSLRLHRAGWPLMVDHQVAIRHEHHTAARQDPGFLPLAADWEDAYLRARLGPDWKVVIRRLSHIFVDVDDTRIPDLD